jgi:hypothetical protein
MEITLVKAAGPGDRDRAYLEADGVTRRGPVHVIHDLPHLAVESMQQRWMAVPPGGKLTLSWPLRPAAG